MSFVQYILFILQKTGKSLQAGLNTFFESMGEETNNCSRQAFSKGRLRIKPEAILELLKFGVSEFYTNADYQRFKGYRVLAIDGTKLNLPIRKNWFRRTVFSIRKAHRRYRHWYPECMTF